MNKGCRGPRLVGKMVTDCKRHPPEEASPNQFFERVGTNEQAGFGSTYSKRWRHH